MPEKTIHKAFFKECKNADTIIIFIHGITEGPNQFKDLAKTAFCCGCSYKALLLPGHGSTGDCFAKSTLEDWKNFVLDNINELKKNYSRVILVGHSMGALLSLYACGIRGDLVDGIFCIAVPVYIHARLRGLAYCYKIVFNKTISSSYEIAARECHSIENSSIKTYLSWAPCYAGLFKLIKETTAILDKIKAPVCIVQSKKDEWTSKRSVSILEKGLVSCKYKTIWLKKSGHIYYTKEDKLLLKNEFEKFINSICKR